ncbi:predicted protein [Arabidopsis lyrata subsp. lyrata]|uniref:Predicted protein n=1 Tax=Arabidopsis lyrata subsp. lyrata TaxID=81972 RepID=D7MAE6_ARALL|nr:predicted protein [Arabidopsis lyrata subsp. lyrata]
MNEKGDSSTSLSFITTTYVMVDDLSSYSIISWSQSGKSFIIWNPEEFSSNLLQRFFKTNSLDLFFFNLEIHCFRKIDSRKWDFANDNFVRDQPHLINNIISFMIEERDQLDRKMDMIKAERLFTMQVKEVEDQLQPNRCYPNEQHSFLTKAYEMVDDPSSDKIVSWSQSGKSFIIWNP